LQPGETRKYGTTIAPGLYAPVHQHFFVARMDMAVDCKPGEAFNQVSVGLKFSLGKIFNAEGIFWMVVLQYLSQCNSLIAHLKFYVLEKKLIA